MAVCPGYLGSTLGFRAELARLPARRLGREALLAATGGVAGALLLLVTPAATFRALVPWLLLFATVLFAAAPRLVRWRAATTAPAGAAGAAPGHAPVADVPTPAASQSSRAPRNPAFLEADVPPPAVSQSSPSAAPTTRKDTPSPCPWWQPVALFAVAVYGGYFNGGLGILLMALYALAGERHLHTANALKNLNSLVLSLLSVAAFAMAGLVVWPQALLMMLAATAGGYLGARVAQRLPTAAVRAVVIATGAVMTALFFVRG